MSLFSIFSGLGYACLVAIPASAAWFTRRWQHQTMERCRALFTIAVRAHQVNATDEAKRNFEQIRLLERRWAGARKPSRIILKITLVSLLGGVLYAAMKLIAIHFALPSGLDGQPTEILFITVFYTIVGGVFTFTAREWFVPTFEISDFGNRLERILFSSREVVTAPAVRNQNHSIDGLSARQVLGLGHHFTKADVERAFKRFAKLLHPDTQPNASEAAKASLEAAFKRASAARDELISRM